MFSLLANLDLIDPRVTLPLIFGFLAVGIGAVIYFDTPRPEPAFEPGQMVRMKAFDATGMIAGGYCVRSGCRYEVRFSPVSKVEVREFEIEAV